MKIINKTPILLPSDDVSLTRFAVVACDQFTSNKPYWNEVERLAESVPSSAHFILPEIYLHTEWEQHRLEQLPTVTKQYIRDVLTNVVNGAVAVERILSDGSVRQGLVVAIDLEQYAFDGSSANILPTENTIVSRIPARCEARRRSELECPHILMLLDDAEKGIIEPIFKQPLKKLYDFELQQNGGKIKGYAVTDDRMLEDIQVKITKLYVGDGNHSLAAAKTLYQEIKQQIGDAATDHPARYCLVEIVNLYSDALPVLPIHRILFNVNLEDFKKISNDVLGNGKGRISIYHRDGEHIIEYDENRYPLCVLATDVVCEEVIKKVDGATVDYIHGDDELRELSKDGIGLLMPYPQKSELIPYIEKNGVFPKKYFSLGHGTDKRYYLECRRITR